MSEATDGWAYAIACDEVDDDDVMPALVGESVIAIYRLGDEFYATQDNCPHGDASLADGMVDGDEIECPLHQGRFCIRDGAARSGPVDGAIATYPTRVADGAVYVKLPGAASTE